MIEIAGVRPNIVLVAVVLVTVLWGFETGIGWAFVAGLTANLLVREPLGSIPFELLVAVALVAGGERLFSRLPWVYPVFAALVASILVDGISLVILGLVEATSSISLPIRLIVSAAIFNAAIAGLFLYPARRLALGRGVEEKAAW